MIDDLLAEFPEPSRSAVKKAWDALPAAAQVRLRAAVTALPGDLGRWRKLISLALAHLQLAAGSKGKVAIVGPANVGKSTLYNQLVRAPQDRSEVSPLPGTTRESREADAGLFAVVDTPGADAVGEVGEREKALALAAAGGADFLVVVFDAAQGVKRADKALFDELAALGRPHVVALNKVDLVKGHADRAVSHAARALGLELEQVVPCAALSGRNVDRLLVAIVKAEPALAAALGQALPAYRRSLAHAATQRAAGTAAAVALAPLPILDLVPLLAVQGSLVLGVARIYDYRITPRRAKELIATFGVGLLGRTLFQQVSKLGGPPGWVLAAAIAGSTTAAIGYAAALWFEKGERVSAEGLRALARGLARQLTQALGGLGRRRPRREDLERQVAGALAEAAPPNAEARPPE